ncbi:MAG TPA: hypothetical protein VFC31_10270 [Candidatus Limnocylindria bacterium]|nr:hypothetical protein [Candidatus Limnocylindria bacterium]
MLVLAAAAFVLGGATTAYAQDPVPPVTGTCSTDGSADTGNSNIDQNKDTQTVDTADEADTANDGEKTTDTANDQCGRDETGDKHDDAAGAGTATNTDEGNANNADDVKQEN